VTHVRAYTVHQIDTFRGSDPSDGDRGTDAQNGLNEIDSSRVALPLSTVLRSNVAPTRGDIVVLYECVTKLQCVNHIPVMNSTDPVHVSNQVTSYSYVI
jgi:hypothetical protein